jgi:hypothetical protein
VQALPAQFFAALIVMWQASDRGAFLLVGQKQLSFSGFSLVGQFFL